MDLASSQSLSFTFPMHKIRKIILFSFVVKIQRIMIEKALNFAMGWGHTKPCNNHRGGQGAI